MSHSAILNISLTGPGNEVSVTWTSSGANLNRYQRLPGAPRPSLVLAGKVTQRPFQVRRVAFPEIDRSVSTTRPATPDIAFIVFLPGNNLGNDEIRLLPQTSDELFAMLLIAAETNQRDVSGDRA